MAVRFRLAAVLGGLLLLGALFPAQAIAFSALQSNPVAETPTTTSPGRLAPGSVSDTGSGSPTASALSTTDSTEDGATPGAPQSRPATPRHRQADEDSSEEAAAGESSLMVPIGVVLFLALLVVVARSRLIGRDDD